MSDDFVIRGLGLGGRARAVAALTTATVERLRAIHDPSPEVAAAVGRLATGALLLAVSLEKVTGREPVLTVEVQGNGPVGRMVATASPAGWVRAFALSPRATAPPRPDGKLDVAAVVGDRGHLVVTRDSGVGEPFRGVVPLFSGEIAKDLAFYLGESEQTPAAVALGVFVVPEGRVSHAGGLVVQLLPGVSDGDAAALEERVRDLGPVTTALRAGSGPGEWLEALFPGDFEALGRAPVSFRCGCSGERTEAAVKLLGAAEIGDMVRTSRGRDEMVTCEFCRTVYRFTTPHLERLLAEVRAETEAQ